MIDRRQFLLAGGLAAAVSSGSAEPSRLSTPELQFSLTAEKGKPARLLSLRNQRSGFEWAASTQPMSPVFGSEANPNSSWTVAATRVKASELQVDFVSPEGVAAGQRSRLLPDLGVIEFGCAFRNSTAGSLPAINSFGPLRIPLRPNLGALQVHCIRRNSYAAESLPLEDVLELHGGRWNGPEHCGLLVLEAIGSREFLVAGIEWERGWRYKLTRKPEALWLEIDISDLRHDLAAGETLASPPVFLALTSGSVDDAFGLAQRYLKAYVFPKPLPDSPWVVYDIWGTESQGVEQALLDEMEFAAGLGIELFYIDASWYKGSSKKGNGDWGCGLGNYTEDREKFPHGLAHFSEKVHAKGMKFGLWVGPNIVDSRLIPDTIPQRWVAQMDGVDRVLKIKTWESPCPQICLGCPDYIDHLKKHLARIVDEFQLDWLKWDNSGIPGIPGQCNRADHGHQAGDGSYAALAGQYEIFRHLHDKFPKLVLEQCGYGSRLDYGLARTIRANWLSDSSFPSSHVRENALVASHIYPSFYNGGWVVKDPELEKTKDPDILDTIYRSRMIGLFGFGTLNGTLPERVSLYPPAVLDAARRNIPIYKRYRHLLYAQAYHLFPPAGSPEGWQAVEFSNEEEAVVLCFRGKSTQSTMRVPVRGSRPTASYKVTTANDATVRSVTGSQLMRDGLIVSLSKPEMSNVLFLTAESSRA
jgi:alpha-galactosidase